MEISLVRPSRTLPLWSSFLLIAFGCNAPSAPPPESSIEKHTAALGGENLSGANLSGANLSGANLSGANLGGVNLSGANLGGTNLSGANLSGANLSGANLGGNNLGGNNLSGANLSGANLSGANLSGANLSGANLGGSNLSGSNLSGANTAGNNLSGTNLSGANLSGANSGSNIHGLSGPVDGMLYSGEDLWATQPERCVVMGIGSTAFAKLLGQQSPNADVSVALGKLPWGFAATSGGPTSADVWEAIVWGDRTYCSFVLVAPAGTGWRGVAGFIKAVFRWQAPPTQTMYISGIEASAPYDSTLDLGVYSYTGMMDAAAQFRAGRIGDKEMVAGEVAFATATTNNQSVMVDFASWVMDSTRTGLVLGNVQSVNPPTRAESVYYVVDNGDGTVSVRIAAARSTGTTVVDTYDELNASWAAYQNNPPSPKPVPVRCGGALFLNYYYGEPVPAGKCDDGLTWGNASVASGARKWATVSGTTAPMNQYMLLPVDAATPLMRGQTADDLRPVLSETYIHTWDTASSPATGVTVIDDSVVGTGLNQIAYGANWMTPSTTCYESYNHTSTGTTTVGATATLTFQGTQVQLYANTHPTHAIAGVSVDGGPETQADLYAPARRGYQLVWSSPTLAPGTHTVTVRHTGTRNPLSTATGNGHIVLDAFVVSSASSCVPEPDVSFCYRQAKNCGQVTGLDSCGLFRTVASCGSCWAPQTCGGAGAPNVCGHGTVVDDGVTGTSSNQFNYSGSGWIHQNFQGAGSYNSTRSSSANVGETVSIPFTGVQIKLYGISGPAYGIGGVRIDGGVETAVDFYSASLIGDQLLFTSPLLAAGPHTLTLLVKGLKNDLSTGYGVALDRVTSLADASCVPESDADFCSRLGKNCDAVVGADNCGFNRTVTCGTCAAPQSCSANVCALISQTPYGGTPWTIPGTIEAENYDNGGPGVAYFDTTLGNGDGAYRHDDVDVGWCIGGYNLGHVTSGEWVEYTVNVTASDRYDLQLRFATPSAGRTMYFQVDGTDLTGTIALPDTAGFGNYTLMTIPSLALTAGPHVLRMGFGGGVNVDWFSFRPNLFSNPFFTSGITGWSTSFSSKCAATFTPSTTAQDGDGASAKVAIGTYTGTLTWSNARIFQVRTANGLPYTVRASFQKTEGTSKTAVVFCQAQGGSSAFYNYQACTNTSGWTTCAVTCTPPAGKSVAFGIGVGDSNVDVLIDAMSLTQ